MKKFSIEKGIQAEDNLHIKRVSNKIVVTAELAMFEYTDKDTNQIICYIPSLEITGYGDDSKEAKKMIEFCVDDFFKLLSSKSQKSIEIELNSLGWRKNRIKNKEFSKAYVDVEGDLKDFAIDNSIKQSRLVAA